MAVLKPRTRVVFFRVSQEEFQEFMRACENSGARSASDFVRLAIRRMIATKSEPAPPGPAPRQGSNVETQLEHLAARLDQLNETIREHFGKEDSQPAYEDGASTTASARAASSGTATVGSSSQGGVISAPNVEEFEERAYATERE